MPHHRAVLQASKIVYFGSFGPAPMAVARSCAARGIQVYLLEPGPPPAGRRRLSSAVTAAAWLNAEDVLKPAGIQGIRDYAREAGAQGVLALADEHLVWLAENRQAFAGVCKVLVPSLECLNVVTSKRRQIELAQAAGFTVLPTFYLRQPADADAIDGSLYPVCLRPAYDGAVSPGFKVEVAGSRDELAARLRGWQVHDVIVAQPFLHLPNLIVHAASSEQAEVIAMASFLVDRKFEGVGLRIQRVEIPEGLRPCVERFGRAAGLTGAYHYDFLYSPPEGKVYFLEVNPRFGGTTDKVLWLGFDEPALCLHGFELLNRVEPVFGTRRSAVVNKRTILKHLLYTMTGRLREFDYPPASRLRHAWLSCHDLIFAKDSVFSWRDLRGSLAFQLRFRRR